MDKKKMNLTTRNLGSVLKWILRKTLRVFLVFLAFILLYLIIGFILSRISTSKELSKDQTIEIFVLFNGVHTDVVMPYTNKVKNWKRTFPSSNTRGTNTDFNWVAVGWGDKGFYLDTPTWGDLTFKTATKAAFGLSTAAVHATLYKNMGESETAKSIRISKEQYKLLVKYIDAHVRKSKLGLSQNISTNAVYGDDDAFYESRGIYSMFHTCNTWANGALKACKQRACLWTWNSSSILRLHEK
ncbi:MAG: TIGR02117 family protein [Crocinitomicaceae bacterium]|nr:TIGR02117 family protein [Crocinitomicaceae bacterium]